MLPSRPISLSNGGEAPQPKLGVSLGSHRWVTQLRGPPPFDTLSLRPTRQHTESIRIVMSAARRTVSMESPVRVPLHLRVYFATGMSLATLRLSGPKE